MLMRLLSKLPLSFLYSISTLVCFFAYYVVGFKKKVVYRNLESSFPEKSEDEIRSIAKDFYRNIFEVAAEVLKAGSMSPRELNERVKFTNLDFFDVYIEQQQPVIILGAHLVNWEWVSLVGCLNIPFPTEVIYQPLHNKTSDSFMLAMRSRFDTHMVPSKQAIGELMRRKDRFRAVAMIADQCPNRSVERHWTVFLNQETAFHVGCEKIARFTNYPVVVAYGKRLKRGHYQVSFDLLAQPPYEEGGFPIVETYARKIEATIRAAPSDWLWFHRRWKHEKPLYD